MAGTASAAATPITWKASGVIEHINDSDPFGELDAVSIGMPWTLELTFDPDAPGVLYSWHHPTYPTYIYEDVVTAKFGLGTWEYTSLGNIWVNGNIPELGGYADDGKPGLVQFEIHSRWSDAAGGPDLNTGVGLMIGAYNDANAFDGSLPRIPVWSAEQGVRHGLWWTTLGTPGAEFLSSFNPTVVPEPTSLLLVGSGLALLVARRRRRQDRGADAAPFSTGRQFS